MSATVPKIQTEVIFQAATTYSDGVTPLSAADAASLSYVVLLDTVNPPVKPYAVPAANVAAAIAGLITVKFTELNFVPVKNMTYYGDVYDTTVNAQSANSNEVSFLYDALVPAAPTNFSVA